MTKEQVITMAREAGLFTHKEVQPEILRFATLVRNAALEEAAIEMQGLYSLGGDDIAAVLRAMKEPTT